MIALRHYLIVEGYTGDRDGAVVRGFRIGGDEAQRVVLRRAPVDLDLAALAGRVTEVEVKSESAGQIDELLDVLPIDVIERCAHLQVVVQQRVLGADFVLPQRIGGEGGRCRGKAALRR